MWAGFKTGRDLLFLIWWHDVHTAQVEHNEDIQSVVSKDGQFLPDVTCVQSLVDLVDIQPHLVLDTPVRRG